MKKINFTNVLSIYVITICMGYLFCAAYLKSVNRDALTQGQTVIVNILMLVVGYVWGSSKGSSKKDETIESLLNPTESSTIHTDISKVVETKPEDKST